MNQSELRSVARKELNRLKAAQTTQAQDEKKLVESLASAKAWYASCRRDFLISVLDEISQGKIVTDAQAFEFLNEVYWDYVGQEHMEQLMVVLASELKYLVRLSDDLPGGLPPLAHEILLGDVMGDLRRLGVLREDIRWAATSR